jgi:hypothetical protein
LLLVKGVCSSGGRLSAAFRESDELIAFLQVAVFHLRVDVVSDSSRDSKRDKRLSIRGFFPNDLFAAQV